MRISLNVEMILELQQKYYDARKTCFCSMNSIKFMACKLWIVNIKLITNSCTHIGKFSSSLCFEYDYRMCDQSKFRDQSELRGETILCILRARELKRKTSNI